MEIKVLGPGCANCKRLYAEAEKAVAQSGRPATLTKVEAVEDIVAFGVMRTPALVIDGRVVTQGRIPSAGEIVSLITTQALAVGVAPGPRAEALELRDDGDPGTARR
jgi:small redox-active disulfide protein 2